MTSYPAQEETSLVTAKEEKASGLAPRLTRLVVASLRFTISLVMIAFNVNSQATSGNNHGRPYYNKGSLQASLTLA